MNRRKTPDIRVVAVTGGARGIGAEIATAFRATGAEVAIGDTDRQAAEQTARESDVHAYSLDVTDPASIEDFLGQVRGDLGPIDVFVSNAGLMWVGPFAEEPHSAARAQVEVNLLGVINGIKAVAPAMVARGRGHLITVASAASILPTPGEASYAATKHGVLGYLKAVRAELRGRGVQITAIMPGVVDTALGAGTSSGAAKLLSPAEVAAAVVKSAFRPRFEVTLPGFIGPAVRVAGLLPTGLRDRLFGALVPDQVAQVRPEERRGYERSFTLPER
ncbi:MULTISPECIES: SDR family oxidoreductase [unclassified Brevibacterium]|uniref:SDR family oxidoreductase n=1 Tax=unclassified Brevibacterium TaxID=2614124 RepID=UPI001081822D|nr:SDR family oxidoreductase [Brevibacterium sp. S111]TGD13794.1 SDR family oxidoreductase [Brevibacterium sp. S111]